VILAVGTRLQDYTTGSWTCFAQDARIVSINTAGFDANKHRSLAVVGDALASIEELAEALPDWRAAADWTAKACQEFAGWNRELDRLQQPTSDAVPSYAQVIGVVNAKAGDRDLLITAAGGLPGEVTKNWRVKTPHTFDCEFGFSCMGYEIAAGWGAAMADSSRTPIVMVGDGSYLMMNSDVYSSVLSGHKFILVVCDNGGYAVINRLQNAKGGASFNNLIADCRVREPFSVDFTAHAASMGALTRRVKGLVELGEALDWARTTDRTTVIFMVTDAFTWTPGDAWWDVGVPEVSNRESVRQESLAQRAQRGKQRLV
jgi:3D-(3,5/4)-trihydroxycyclohexane-1,2-dione acylhydrolase (decyclizing)